MRGERADVGGYVFELPVASVAIDEARSAMRVFFENLFNFRVHISRDGEDVCPTVVVEVEHTGSPLHVLSVVETG